MKQNAFFSVILSAGLLFSPACNVQIFPIYAARTASVKIVSDDMHFILREEKDRHYKNSGEIILTSYSGDSASLTIPEKIDGHTVTAIDDDAFSGCDTLGKVTLPDSINYFGKAVFRDSSVRSVNIPKGVKMIPSCTFYNCQDLTDVAFHDNIAAIANTAFKKTGVTVPDKLKSRVTGEILDDSEASCTFTEDEWVYDILCLYGEINLNFTKYTGKNKDIVMPDDLNYYDLLTCDHEIFSEIKDIKSVVFPEDMTDVTVRFTDSSIEKAVLPQNIGMSDSMFENCKKLKTVVFSGENCNIIISDRAFRNCNSLTDIKFPENCDNITIGKNAFENTGIAELSLNYPSEIGSSAFSGCGSLKTVKLNDANVSNRAFMNCSSLSEMTFSGNTVLDDLSLYGCDSLENIVFNNCKLTSYNAFRDCPKLYTIDVKTVFDTTKDDFIPLYKDFIFSHFNGSDNIGFINDYVIAQADRIVKEYTNDSMSDMEKAAVLHDWVCDNTKYTEGEINNKENHNDASVFMNEYTVCEGYARACNLLYHSAGIETYYVHSSDHAWNIVNIGGHYFHVDTTWDDLDGISRKWFMKSDDEFRKAGGSHAEWVLSEPSPLHEFQKDVLPECKYRMGDVNADGNINTADLVTLQKYLHGRSGITKSNSVLADTCCNGVTDVLDMVTLRRKVINELA